MKKKNLLKIEVYLGKSGPEVIARSPSGLQSSLSSVDGAAQIWHPTHPCGWAPPLNVYPSVSLVDRGSA